jgi:hypothetical protein
MVKNGCGHFSRDPQLSLRTRMVCSVAEVKLFSPDSVTALFDICEKEMEKVKFTSHTAYMFMRRGSALYRTNMLKLST